MSPTKYEIPEANLYLSEEGVFSPEVEPGEKLVDLTDKHARILDVIYHGNAIRPMPSLKGSGGGSKEGKDEVT